jgi:hypothetical protein
MVCPHGDVVVAGASSTMLVTCVCCATFQWCDVQKSGRTDSGLEEASGKLIPLGFSAAAAQSTCARTLRRVSFTRRGMKQPDIGTVAHVKRSYLEGMPALLSLQHLPHSSCTHFTRIDATREALAATAASPGGVAAPVTPVKPQPLWQTLTSPSSGDVTLTTTTLQTAATTVTIASGMGVGLSPGLSSPPIRTDLERYLLMQQTSGRRLTHGKSSIHGTGVFARVNHLAGDWLIEYSGAIAHPCCSSQRAIYLVAPFQPSCT